MGTLQRLLGGGNSFELPNVPSRTWPSATRLTALPLCLYLGLVLISGGYYYVINSVLVLRVETLCRLLGLLFVGGFLKLI